MMSYAKELPEDPVDGGDGGDGGGVAHSLGEKLLPDLPGKHPCHKFYLPVLAKFYLPNFIQVLSPKFYPSFISQANIPATTFTLASSTCFSPGLSVFSLMILFTTDGVATCCTKKDFRNRISGMRFQG